MTDADRFQTGSEFAGYRIERVLGRGGMGVVYLAEQLSLGRKVALKVLVPELADNPGFRVRFESESRLAAAIDHPNIIPLYEAGEDSGLLFITMRYVRGTDLLEVLRAEPVLPMDRALQIASQVGAALDAAHESGLVHRDVKPGNVLVASGAGAERSDHCYLTDFGLTKDTANAIALTATGQFVGTIDYVAPEQIDGSPDGRGDQYSLACMTYECLTGSVPFKRDSEVAVLWAHLQEPPPKISEQQPGLPPALDAVFAKAMDKDPDARYESCRDFAQAAAAAATAAPHPPAAPPTRAAMQMPPGQPTRAAAAPVLAAGAATAAPPLAAAANGGAGADAGAAAFEPARAVPDTGGQGRRLATALVAGVVLIAAAAFAGSQLGGSGDAGTPKATNVAAGGPLRVSFPSTWGTNAGPDAIPGITLTDQVALAPTGAAGADATMLAGSLPASVSLLPSTLRAGLTAKPPPAQIVKLETIQAYRYAGLRPSGGSTALTLFLVPTKSGRVAMVCSAPVNAPRSVTTGCERIVSSATVDQAATDLQPDAAYAKALSQLLARLGAVERTQLARLGAATTSAQQTAPARALAAAAATARVSAGRLNAPLAIAPADAALASALGDRAAAYRSLAAAAAAHDTSAYRAASAQARQAARRLAAATTALNDYGYR